MVPEQLRYAPTHEWCKVEGEDIIVGVTEYGMSPLGNLIYIELPEVGDDVLVEVPFGQIEGTQGVKDLVSPTDGRVLEVNTKLVLNPELMTKGPYEGGWLIRLKPDAPTALDNLLSAADYEDTVRKRRHR
jgi:glycine cleavage system H protein